MTEKRDHLIGARFTKREKEIIENFTESRNTNLTDFVREAIFSHMSNLKKNVGIINLDKIMEEFGKIEDSAKTVFNSIDIIKNLLEEYGLSKTNHSTKAISFHIKS